MTDTEPDRGAGADADTGDVGSDPDSDPGPETNGPADVPWDVPDWDDEYLDRVSDRLLHSYDLEKGKRIRGEPFDLYGEFRATQQKQLLHPALNYANHDAAEHLFARRVDRVRRDELERLVALGHDLADDWIEADEEHYATDFTFVLLAPEIPADVAGFVESFSDRTLLKWGYYGHYQVHLAVIAPEREAAVFSENADTARSFVLWEELEPPSEGLLSRIARRFWESAQ